MIKYLAVRHPASHLSNVFPLREGEELVIKGVGTVRLTHGEINYAAAEIRGGCQLPLEETLHLIEAKRENAKLAKNVPEEAFWLLMGSRLGIEEQLTVKRGTPQLLPPILGIYPRESHAWEALCRRMDEELAHILDCENSEVAVEAAVSAHFDNAYDDYFTNDWLDDYSYLDEHTPPEEEPGEDNQ